MANIKSQKKRNRQNEKRRVVNVAVRSELKTRTKSARRAIAEVSENMGVTVVAAQKRIDKASAKGTIHKNQAARRTSRLMKAANKAAS
ncbi:MAG: 30S ribosomal protein S20 [Acidimicrobiia bacterium]|nr:30S ribosomal protein S20 [Acidimicrobiia bacterium]